MKKQTKQAQYVELLHTAGEVQIAYLRKADKGVRIANSRDAVEVLRPYYSEYMEHREAMFIIALNRANNVIAVARISEGGIAGTVADPKIIFQHLLLVNASSFILSHNHPSGNTEPSNADRDITKKLKSAGEALDLPLLDHVILTEDSYFSFADQGLI